MRYEIRATRPGQSNYTPPEVLHTSPTMEDAIAAFEDACRTILISKKLTLCLWDMEEMNFVPKETGGWYFRQGE